jgi:hypothetical protein
MNIVHLIKGFMMSAFCRRGALVEFTREQRKLIGTLGRGLLDLSETTVGADLDLQRGRLAEIHTDMLHSLTKLDNDLSGEPDDDPKTNTHGGGTGEN